MSETAFVWRDGQPYSGLYGDIYFSRDSGISESRYVFLTQNTLQERWERLGPGAQFVIGETGFGTGLNFLCAWQLWLQAAPATCRLHFVSTELHPIPANQLRAALDLWPELSSFSAQFLRQYADLAPGWHRFSFEDGRVMLTLLVGDAVSTFAELDATVDAWFLDGFSPAKNPDLWSETLFTQIARCSAKGTTFATFTSAGQVRRGLATVGFDVEKVAGHGNKREMSRGVFQGGGKTTVPDVPKNAIVIGAGLAGCATAHSLAMRGWKVQLLDRRDSIAAEASGNRQGILYARLSPKMSPLSELTLAGYQHALRCLHAWLPQTEDTWRACGLLQLAFDDTEADRLKGIANLGFPETLFRRVDAEQAAEVAGVPLQKGGLYFPGSGWVSPPALCRVLSGHERIQIKLGFNVEKIASVDEAWQVVGSHGEQIRAPVVIIAGAAHTRQFSQTAHLPLRSIRGQVSHVPAKGGSHQLRTVLCTEGYAAPARSGVHTIGATYGNLEETLELREADHLENLAMLEALSPDLYQSLEPVSLDPALMDGRAACRCNVADYLPLVGEIESGLYVNTGHGSRGLITSMLAAEALASILGNEPAPLPSKLMSGMSPHRFKSSRKERSGS